MLEEEEDEEDEEEEEERRRRTRRTRRRRRRRRRKRRDRACPTNIITVNLVALRGLFFYLSFHHSNSCPGVY